MWCLLIIIKVIGNAGNDSQFQVLISDIVSVGGGIGGFSSGNFDGGWEVVEEMVGGSGT